MKLILAQNLKKELREQDISVAKLSRAVGVPSQTIHNWLTGLEPRSMTQLKKVANYLKISLDELAYGDACIERNSLENLKPLINIGIFEVILKKLEK